MWGVYDSFEQESTRWRRREELAKTVLLVLLVMMVLVLLVMMVFVLFVGLID